VPVANPSFDVTPAHLITAIITEQGVASAPYNAALAQMIAATQAAAPAPRVASEGSGARTFPAGAELCAPPFSSPGKGGSTPTLSNEVSK
jgi:hypothetical protein